MAHRKSYRMESWRRWDRHVDACAQDFRERFGIEPNVMIANRVTFKRINLAADRSHVGNAAGDVPDPLDYVDITGFAGKDYELRFAIDDSVQDPAFILMYATDPDGGEPLEDDAHDEVRTKGKKRATGRRGRSRSS